jgi:hypothetical protein
MLLNTEERAHRASPTKMNTKEICEHMAFERKEEK